MSAPTPGDHLFALIARVSNGAPGTVDWCDEARRLLAEQDAQVRAAALAEERRKITARFDAEISRVNGLLHQPAGAPDFFQPGHSYTRRDGTTFRCDAVTTHPESCVRLALGWHTDLADWTFLAHRDINAWRYEYDGCEPPAGDTPCAVCGVSRDAHREADWRHLYMTPSGRDNDATPGEATQ